MLCFDGAKSSVFKKKQCKRLCENEENNLDSKLFSSFSHNLLEPAEACISTVIGHSSKLFEFYEGIERVNL